MNTLKMLTIAAMLAAAPGTAALAAGPESVTLKVNGLVCDFCARSIEATMKKRPDVAGVHVDLDKGEVHLSLKADSTLDDKLLTRLITDSGYSVTGIARKAGS
jgi:copper chaperone CopZ